MRKNPGPGRVGQPFPLHELYAIHACHDHHVLHGWRRIMKTLTQLRSLVERAGGRLEEDDAGSMTDTRLLQIVAPSGKLWAGSDLSSLVCYWARGSSAQAIRANEANYSDVAERIASGLRDMTPAEREEFAED